MSDLLKTLANDEKSVLLTALCFSRVSVCVHSLTVAWTWEVLRGVQIIFQHHQEPVCSYSGFGDDYWEETVNGILFSTKPSRFFGLPVFNPESLYNPYIICSDPAHIKMQQEGLHGKTMIVKVEGGSNYNRRGSAIQSAVICNHLGVRKGRR